MRPASPSLSLGCGWTTRHWMAQISEGGAGRRPHTSGQWPQSRFSCREASVSDAIHTLRRNVTSENCTSSCSGCSVPPSSRSRSPRGMNLPAAEGGGGSSRSDGDAPLANAPQRCFVCAFTGQYLVVWYLRCRHKIKEAGLPPHSRGELFQLRQHASLNLCNKPTVSHSR